MLNDCPSTMKKAELNQLLAAAHGGQSHLTDHSLNQYGLEPIVPETTDSHIELRLEDQELWHCFGNLTNEMIVTKGGRYVNGEWIPSEKREPNQSAGVYTHPDSPNFGTHWMKESVSFTKVKLSNKIAAKGRVMLTSLHKYQPRIHIVKLNSSRENSIVTRRFTDTQFIAVTAYQNEQITSLKIKYNPFAKAFLDHKDKNDKSILPDAAAQSFAAQYSHWNGWTGNMCGPTGVTSTLDNPSPYPFQGTYHHPNIRNHRFMPYPGMCHRGNTSGTYPSADSWRNFTSTPLLGMVPPTSAANNATWDQGFFSGIQFPQSGPSSFSQQYLGSQQGAYPLSLGNEAGQSTSSLIPKMESQCQFS